MGCGNSRSSSPKSPYLRKEDILLRIPGAVVHLTRDGEAIELARGEFTILKITDEDVSLATVVKVGPHLQWPLTIDEPVIKIDKFHYLFTLQDQDGGFLNYGVTFDAANGHEVYWRDYAPKIDEYNGVLAKAIARGTGEIVKGIFTCSNAYSNQVQKGANLIQPTAAGNNANMSDRNNNINGPNKTHGGINQSLQRVRKLSEMTERMSQSLLDGVLTVTGSVTAPIIRSRAGKAFFSMVPGEVLLASLAAVGTVLDAVEVAERKALAATSGAVSGVVSKRFGENAGVATEDAFATAGHAIGTAWNLLKIRKAITPSSSVSSAIVKNAVKRRT
ncbi:senescence/dehydration-associated protein At4g35985, chloroplastic-like isoform X2 [Asparagus officinalis]|uniref:senescence/dehydration-associated protein At4g35985, chloroplastic-like isoform X2 n=1 Tax=Asparagus officinalis TaxID=4686 RepID=UPI00098DF05C|nr:senescence/dehydration-associated protein At4g35985, chloroplastic-like isoform X2 [Asparagus officinalis]